MNEVTEHKQSAVLALGGAGFLLLSGFFLWRDLALPPQAAPVALALLAAVAVALDRPRRWPMVPPALLLATTVLSGLWFLAVKDPALIPAPAIALAGSVAALLRMEQRRGGEESDLRARLIWYAAGAAFLAASWTAYFHFMTTGFAAESLVRRLIPTVVWLAVGLALIGAARARARAAAQVGLVLVGVAVAKAAFYDTTHLQGLLRVEVLAVVGALLLAGARMLRPAGR